VARDDGEVTEVPSVGPSLLEIEDLTVAYGRTRALSGVTLSVGAGTVVAVAGGSGAGKTTLMRAVSGLLALHDGRITRGRVTLDGRSLVALPAANMVRLGVACVLEGRRVFRDLTVEENLRAGGFVLRSRAEVRAAVERVLDQLPLLARRRDTKAGYLSGGEQQLLVLGRALVGSPRLLLLDDPALGLAPPAVETVAEVLADVAGNGTGVLLAERRATGYGEAGVMARACGAEVVTLDAPTPAGPRAAVR
jgi:branched-chain amino acid transport system ATP-binding protein